MSNVNANTIRAANGSLGTDIRIKNTSVYESDGGTSVTQNLVQGLSKAWGQYSGSGSTYADSFNLASATDNGTGDYTFTITNDMSNDDYAPSNIGGMNNITAHTFAAGSLRCQLANNADSLADAILCLTFHGDLA